MLAINVVNNEVKQSRSGQQLYYIYPGSITGQLYHLVKRVFPNT